MRAQKIKPGYADKFAVAKEPQPVGAMMQITRCLLRIDQILSYGLTTQIAVSLITGHDSAPRLLAAR